MKPSKYLAASTWLLVALGPGTGPASGAAAINTRLEAERVEAVEGFADALGSELLRLSSALQRGDAPAVQSFYAEDLVAAPFPSIAGPLRRDLKWISAHDWSAPLPGGVAAGGTGGKKGSASIVLSAVDRDTFLTQMTAFLAHFSVIDDLRFEMEEAEVPDPSLPEAEAKLGFQVIGRDGDGRREWVRGGIDAGAERRQGGWKITRWTTGALHSEVVPAALFSEVSAPAGIAHDLPPFGVPPNEGFLPHGGAVADVDGDGLMDLLLTELDGARLYVNDGHGGFRDVSESTRLRGIPRPTAAAFLDFDTDGDEDIFMSADGPQMLFENWVDPNGIRRYRDVSAAAGVAVKAVGLSVAVADVNNDSLPDVYVASSNRYGSVMPNSWSRATNGTPNLLFVNIGFGRFRESAHVWGVDDARWSNGAAFADVNGDSWQDLYVANEFGENALYFNKRIRFEDEAARRGIQGPGGGRGVSWGDYDNDGDLDLHVCGISSAAGRRILGRLPSAASMAGGDHLFQNRGNGWFTDVSPQAGPFHAGWAYGGGFFDFDNDGWEDLLSVNGFVSGRVMEDTSSLYWRHVLASAEGLEKAGNEEYHGAQMGRIFKEGLSFAGSERDALFMNLGDGKFRDISALSEIDSISDGRGAIFADFDNDGDLDVVTTTSQRAACLLFRNNAGQENNFLRVTLEGTRSGRHAYGAIVRLKTSHGIQTRIQSAGSGFVSVHDPRLLFGLGADETAEWLEVTWPSGLKQRAGGIQARDSLKLKEGAEAAERVTESRFRLADPPGPGAGR